MAKIYSTIRAGKTVRERLELLLEANPYNIGRVAPTSGIIDLVDEKKRITSVIHEPLVYNHQKPDEVREFFTGLLEIFTADRTEAPENRRLKEEAEWHEVIDKLDERFILYKGKADNSVNSDLTAIKATAKSDLDDILNVELKAYEQEFKSIGVNAFHSVIDRLDEVATYITDKLEKLRQQKKREQIKSGLPPVERNLRILESTQPDFIHRRFFQAFVGYKCEELKKAIDDYNPHSKNETSSLGKASKVNETFSQNENHQEEEYTKKNGEPLSDEFFEWFRTVQPKVGMNHFIIACWSQGWHPFQNEAGKWFNDELKDKRIEELRSKLDKIEFNEFTYSAASIIQNDMISIEDLAIKLIGKGGITTSRTISIIGHLENSPLTDRAKAKLSALKDE